MESYRIKFFRLIKSFQHRSSFIRMLVFILPVIVLVGTMYLFYGVLVDKAHGTPSDWCSQAGAIVNPNEQVPCQFRYANKYQFNLSHSPSLGSDRMGITFVAYEDFNCEACGELGNTMGNLLSKYGNGFKFYHKHFPIDRQCNSHTRYTTSVNGCLAHKASIAAQSFGVFWVYYDVLYGNFGNYTRDDLIQYAQTIGLDANAFEQLMDSPAVNQQLRSDIEEGWNLGRIGNSRVIYGTPTLFVNGALIKAPPTEEHLTNIIEALSR